MVRGQRGHLVVFAKQLHADHGEDEDDDGEDERQVAQGAHGVANDLDQGVQGRPGASELEHTKLEAKRKTQEETEFKFD